MTDPPPNKPSPIRSIVPPAPPPAPAPVSPLLIEAAQQAAKDGRWHDVQRIGRMILEQDPVNTEATMLLGLVPANLPPPAAPTSVAYAPNPVKAQLAAEIGKLEQTISHHQNRIQAAQHRLAAAKSQRTGALVAVLVSLLGFVFLSGLWFIWVFLIPAGLITALVAGGRQRKANADITHAQRELADAQFKAAPLKAQILAM